MSPARFWAGGFAAAPRIPLVGDADGDGRADLLVIYPPGEGIVDLARTSASGKSRFPLQARTGFGKDILTGTSGRFSGSERTEVLALSQDWSLQIAYDLDTASGKYQKEWKSPLIAPEKRLKKVPALAAVIPTANGMGHVLLADADGNLLLLQNKRTSGGGFGFEAIPLRFRLSRVRQMAVAPSEGNSPVTVFWMDNDGKVYRTILGPVESLSAKGPMETRLLLRAAPGEKFAIGKFRGVSATDVIVGQHLLPDGDPNKAITIKTLPEPAVAKGDLTWLAGDFDGDGKDDIVRIRRSSERYTGDDIFLHFARASQTTEDNLASTSGDGLLDAWKTGKIKPGGLDLAALGCKVGRYDIIVEVQRIEDTPEDVVRRDMERAVRYYANLPVTNPDGSKGIALHVIYREPIPISEKRLPWWELGAKYHPNAHRGVTHWMSVYNGGGGQSDEMADRGSTGSNALYATFLHEFGHQLGLDHTGNWQPAWCPIYPSLMNYAYSYQLNGKGDDIGYSDGRLSSLILDERKLSEVLPLPPDKLTFLSGPPYHYRMKPTPDGKGTLIDWNWNGVFGERSVSADINYGYSTSGGLRHTIGKTYTAPVLATNGKGKQERLLLFAGLIPSGTPVPPSDAEVEKRSLAPDFPGRLVVRQWNGADPRSDGPKWGEELPIEASGVIGDASAASLGERTWVAYPTTAGVTLRSLSYSKSDDGTEALKISEAMPIPYTVGCSPTLTLLDGQLALLLWRDEKTPVGMCLLRPKGESFEMREPVVSLPFTSRLPVGAIEGAKEKGRPSLWVGLSQDQDDKRTYRWQVRRLVLEKDGKIREAKQEWVGGEQGGQRGQSRPVLLWKSDNALKEQSGQLWFLGAGLFGSKSPWACHYVSIRITDKTVGGGWLNRRYYDEWTQSRSAPGACFFKGEMIFASRWYGNVRGTENDNLFVAFFGRGYESEPMGDKDDIGYIRDVGMSHSIAYVGE